MDPFLELLQKHWGHRALYPIQRKIISASLTKRDLLVTLPTGAGKSLCFQLPACLERGTYLVLAPLIALIEEQVETLNKRGILAIGLHSGERFSLQKNKMKHCLAGRAKLLYIAPERLESATFLSFLKKIRLARVIVDEAHCITMWGADFRPAYRKIGEEIKKLFPLLPITALTATATPRTLADIQQVLSLSAPLHFSKSCRRPNLIYQVKQVWHKERALLEDGIDKRGSSIIYAPTRDYTEKLAAILKKRGNYLCDFYHAGLSLQLRKKKQAAWQAGRLPILIATSAFGMGIDKQEVRNVIHMHIPSSIEIYLQETGRAGRDHKTAYARLYYEAGERAKIDFFSQQALLDLYQKIYEQAPLLFSSKGYIELDLCFWSIKEDIPLKKLEKMIFSLIGRGWLKTDPKRPYKSSSLQLTYPIQKLPFLPLPPTTRKVLSFLIDQFSPMIFYKPYPISLARLAQKLKTAQKKIEEQLLFLGRKEIITYNPGSPFYLEQIKNNASRIKSILYWKEDKKRAQEALHSFLSNQHQCRSLQLQEYFGEVGYHACQKCDNCQQKKFPFSWLMSIFRERFLTKK